MRDPLTDPQAGDVVKAVLKDHFPGKASAVEVLGRCGNAVAIRKLTRDVEWIPLDYWCKGSDSMVDHWEVLHVAPSITVKPRGGEKHD